MKKIAALFLALMCVIGLAGCSGERYTVELTVPAGSAEPFVFSEEEISPRKNTLKISAGAGVSSVEVLLSALGEGESKYFTLRQGKSERIKVEKGEWYKIGAAIQNPEEVAIAAEIIVEDADIR